MQNPMEDGSQNQTRHDQKHQPGVERETRRQQFRPVVRQIANRSHSAEQHRGIQHGIDPREMREPVISASADH